MAGIYEEEILGAKQQAETARKLRELAFQQGVPEGRIVGNRYIAPHWTQHLGNILRQYSLGSQEREATEKADELMRQRNQATIQAMNAAGMEAPETLVRGAVKSAEQPGFMQKAAAFLRGEELAPVQQPTFQQNVAKNVTPEAREAALFQLSHINPEVGQPILTYEAAKSRREEAAAEKQAAREERQAAREESLNLRRDMWNATHMGQPGTTGINMGPRIKVGGGGGGDGGGSYDTGAGGALGGVVNRKDIQIMKLPNGQLARVNKRTGDVMPLEAEGNTPTASTPKPLTESQANAQLYSERMGQAEKELTDVGTEYSPAAVNVAKSVENVPLVGWAANALLPEKAQRVGQAQRDFINAVLRKESGASISPSEFASAQRQYFAQPGDSPEVIAQKERNRKTAQQQIRAAVPGAQQTPATPAPSGGWSIREAK
jgi:hypothetical protein